MSALEGARQDDRVTEAGVTCFPDLYRAVTDLLSEEVSRENGYAPMTKQEVDLMCRCAVTCQTLRQAIACVREFCSMLYPRAAVLELAQEAGNATFTMRAVRRRISSAACLVDVTGLLCFIHLFSWLVGRPIRPRHVFLSHSRMEDAEPFAGLFGVPVQLGARSCGFDFDAWLLDRNVIRQPVELDDFLAVLPFGLVARPSASVSTVQKVRSLFDAAIARSEALPSIDEIAQALDMSAMTVRRRIASEGASYQVLRAQCLTDTARRYLGDSSWTIDEIAGRLGFSSASAFRRAFIAWTGRPPTEYRKSLTAAADAK